ncbi:hypothetical protein K438DRAFT_2026628 [Mycena galopus ATCC 62051]|nr:hypothetical protein K438DRAFT_2026628 [Mycena galopus ATCC 62051]
MTKKTTSSRTDSTPLTRSCPGLNLTPSMKLTKSGHRPPPCLLPLRRLFQAITARLQHIKTSSLPANHSQVRTTVVTPSGGNAEPLPPPSFDAATLSVASGAYGAKTEQKPDKYGSKKHRMLTELISLSFQLIPWNGFDAHPLVDSEGRLFLVLAGQPRDDDYCATVDSAFCFIKQQGQAARFPPSMRHHRCGLFATMNMGLTYGKGQHYPTWLDDKEFTGIENVLRTKKHLARMAHFASFAFSLWVPRLYSHYVGYNTSLASSFPHLTRPFKKSVFSCAAFNFSNVWTFEHCDVYNLPFGWCAVQSLGHFNPQRSRPPAGALILLPSATVAHSNIPVEEREERMSFTQFTAGGLFRFVNNGFRTQAEFAAQEPAEYLRAMELRETRWEEGLRLFSTISELLDKQ